MRARRAWGSQLPKLLVEGRYGFRRCTVNIARHPGRRFFLVGLSNLVLLMSPMFTLSALADLTANPGGPYTGVVGENVQLRGSAFTDGARPAEYQWDFGDGDIRNGPGATVNHKYRSAGTFTVSLTVVDTDGFMSQPVTTTASIVESTTTTTYPTTTTTTTAPTTTTNPTATTTTAPAEPVPTTTTTISWDPTTTTSLSTTTTRLPTTTPAATSTTTPSATTTTFSRSTPTAAPSAVEVVIPQEGLTATSFSLVPAEVSAGGEMALIVTLEARVPGPTAVQFLLDGQPLGDVAALKANDTAAQAGTEAVFTRTLPAGIQIGLHRIDVVTTERPPRVLASQSFEVVSDASPAPIEPQPVPPAFTTQTGLTLAIVVGGGATLAAAGFAAIRRHRRKAIVRRLVTRGP